MYRKAEISDIDKIKSQMLKELNGIDLENSSSL